MANCLTSDDPTAYQTVKGRVICPSEAFYRCVRKLLLSRTAVDAYITDTISLMEGLMVASYA
jgi:hypothetical protein